MIEVWQLKDETQVVYNFVSKGFKWTATKHVERTL